MTEFIQVHILTSYPPSNLNRDDLGRPKTAAFGGSQRLRISSQSLKRAWRTSEFFDAANNGVRTKGMGTYVFNALTTGHSLMDLINEVAEPEQCNPVMAEEAAEPIARAIAGEFGKLKKNGLEIEQIVFFSPNEIRNIDAVMAKQAEPTADDLKLLIKDETAVDIAMFGRMLAAHTDFNVEAAVQVAHAITVNKTVVENDFFTAVDDLNCGDGASHLGESEYGSGVFYIYACINKDLLVSNLGGNLELANVALRGLLEAVTKVAPSGKQASFASRAYASYAMIETGTQQPRSLSVAFLQPTNSLEASIAVLRNTRDRFNSAYGACSDNVVEMNVLTGEGSFDELISNI